MNVSPEATVEIEDRFDDRVHSFLRVIEVRIPLERVESSDRVRSLTIHEPHAPEVFSSPDRTSSFLGTESREYRSRQE